MRWRHDGFRAATSVGTATLAAFRARATAFAPRHERRAAVGMAAAGPLRPAAGFGEEAQAGFAVLDRPSADARASVADRCSDSARPAARRGARAAARQLHRGADERRPGHRRPARRARADRLRAAEGGSRGADGAAPDPADPRGGGAAARRRGAAHVARRRNWPRSGSWWSRSARARWR